MPISPSPEPCRADLPAVAVAKAGANPVVQPISVGAVPALCTRVPLLSRHTVTFVDYQALAKAQPVTFAVTTVTDP